MNVTKMTSQTNLSYDLMCELRSFSKWMKNEHICIETKDGNEMYMDALCIPDFKEPKKNKLSAFMKAVEKKYVVKMRDKKMNKAIDLVKQFKSAKILANDEIDTSDTGYLITLDVSEKELSKAFGNPVYNTVKGQDWSKEWKILINGHPYSIYDWKEGNDWHLAGEKKNKRDTTLLEQHLANLQKAKCETHEEKVSSPKKTVLTNFENELKKQMEEDMKNEMERLSDQLDLDINLDEDDIVFGDILDGLDDADETQTVNEDANEDTDDDTDEENADE